MKWVDTTSRRVHPLDEIRVGTVALMHNRTALRSILPFTYCYAVAVIAVTRLSAPLSCWYPLSLLRGYDSPRLLCYPAPLRYTLTPLKVPIDHRVKYLRTML